VSAEPRRTVYDELHDKMKTQMEEALFALDWEDMMNDGPVTQRRRREAMWKSRATGVLF